MGLLSGDPSRVTTSGLHHFEPMHQLSFCRSTTPLRVLCLGAHADDIEIGCGGFILHLIVSGAKVYVDWIVFSGSPARRREAGRSARMFLRGARRWTVMPKEFRDGFFPQESSSIKETFEELKGRPSRDLILTHYRDDRHQATGRCRTSPAAITGSWSTKGRSTTVISAAPTASCRSIGGRVCERSDTSSERSALSVTSTGSPMRPFLD
jgi:hypothetical protein